MHALHGSRAAVRRSEAGGEWESIEGGAYRAVLDRDQFRDNDPGRAETVRLINHPPPSQDQVSQLSNGPILRVFLPMDNRVSLIPGSTYRLARLLTIAVCFSPKRRN